MILYTLSEISSPHLALLFGVLCFAATYQSLLKCIETPGPQASWMGLQGWEASAGVYAGFALWLG